MSIEPCDGGDRSPDLGVVLRALADDNRRRVVRDLAGADGEWRACGSFALPRAKATRTHHFRVLREAGLIVQEQLGNGSRVRLNREHVESRFPGLLELLLTEAG